MLACAGVFAEATAAEFSVAPGGDIDVTATAINRSQAPVTLEELAFPWGGGATRAAPAGRPLPVAKGQAAATP